MPIYQLADVIGFDGLEFMFYFFQAGLGVFLTAKSTKLRFFGPIGLCLVLMVLNYIGFLKEQSWNDKMSSDRNFQVLIVQDNIFESKDYGKLKGDLRRHFRLNRNIDLTNQAMLARTAPPDLVVWGESAIPFKLTYDSKSRFPELSLFKNIIAWKTNLVTGGFTASIEDINKKESPPISAALVFNKNADVVGIHEKTKMIPFAEYSPMNDLLADVKKLFGFSISEKKLVSKSSSLIELNVNDAIGLKKLGILICFESVTSSAAALLASKGADLIIDLSSNHWLGTGTAALHPFYMVVGRSIETRKFIVRAAISGYSTIIGPTGKLYSSPQFGNEGIEMIEFPSIDTDAEPTFFVRAISYLLIAWLGMALICILVFSDSNRFFSSKWEGVLFDFFKSRS